MTTPFTRWGVHVLGALKSSRTVDDPHQVAVVVRPMVEGRKRD